MNEDEQLAIMTEPQYGMRDMSSPGWWFSVSFGADLSYGALIIMSEKEMHDLVVKHNIHDTEQLKNHTCKVVSKGWGDSVKFVDLVK